MNSLIDSKTIETAIEQHDDREHEDVTTVDDVRDALEWLQESHEEVWNEMVWNIKEGEMRPIHDSDGVIVLSTGSEDVVCRDLREFYEVDLDDQALDVISVVVHELARDLTDWDWGYEYPLVLEKPHDPEAIQQYVEATVNGLIRQGLSPGQAWAYYGVKIRGNSRNSWALRCGYSDHSAISEPVRKADQKLE